MDLLNTDTGRNGALVDDEEEEVEFAESDRESRVSEDQGEMYEHGLLVSGGLRSGRGLLSDDTFLRNARPLINTDNLTAGDLRRAIAARECEDSAVLTSVSTSRFGASSASTDIAGHTNTNAIRSSVIAPPNDSAGLKRVQELGSQVQEAGAVGP
ncbi:hypothetical protein LTR65_008268 [Meristemomyces frigidus]